MSGPEIRGQLPDDRSRWPEAARDLGERLLAELLVRLPCEPDGSAPLETLAARGVVRRALPCPIVIYDRGDKAMVCFSLGGGTFEFTLSEEEGLQRLYPGLEPEAGGFATRREEPPVACFAVDLVPDGSPRLGLSAFDICRWALEARIEQETRRLAQLRENAFEAVGYRAMALDSAPGPAGAQFEGLRASTIHWSRVDTAEDLVQDMVRATRILTVVPDGIESLMQRARLLYVHGWEEWEFLTVAEHYAAVALEASLRALYAACVGERAEITSGGSSGTPVVLEGSRDYQHLAMAARGVKRPQLNGRPFPFNKAQLIDYAVATGALTRWEAERQVGPLLGLRDVYSHPASASMNWIDSILRTMADCALCINLMWVRLGREVPWEFARAS